LHTHLLFATTAVHHFARGLVKRHDADGTLGGGYGYGGSHVGDWIYLFSGNKKKLVLYIFL
jgi:hypothetical protein